ncbi:MAG: hypothetical protein CMM80_05280 [Rhodospirillaceae bacterium]|nr:hypothetical protein [Rhodospirillaceae bacterium]
MKTDWLFDLNRDGSSEGWEDAAIKNFRGNPLNNLAREVIQNSLDAPRSDDASAVTVSFEIQSVPKRSVPDIKQLKRSLDKCIKSSDTFVLPEKLENLHQAEDVLKQNKIEILKISETGTLGMEGPCLPGKPLYKYMKAKGQGGKSFDGARGSHGQGKAAPILCSSLHTIFLSTNWQNENFVMGRATLSSHYGKNEKEIHNNVGYWGANFEPVVFDKRFPDWLRREEPGTNIIILGFKNFENWKELLSASVAMNFFVAIQKGALIVNIQGLEISSETIEDIFEDERILKLVEAQSDIPRGDFERAQGYFPTYVSPEHKEEGEVTNLGFFNFYIREREDNMQNIGLLRDDMFITSEIPRLKRKFGASFVGFDMLIEPASQSSRALIKSMEPPAHDGLNTSWIDSENERKKAENGLSNLRRRVLELLERHLKIDVADTEFHSVFDKFFNIDGGGEQISDATDPTGGYVFSSKRTSVQSRPTSAILSGSWSHRLGGTDIDTEKLNTNDNEGSENETGSGKSKPEDLGSEISESNLSKFKSSPVDLNHVKMKYLSEDTFKVEFSAARTGNLKLLAAQQGSDLKTMLRIKDATKGTVLDDGGLVLQTTTGEINSIEVSLSEPFSGALVLLASSS